MPEASSLGEQRNLFGLGLLSGGSLGGAGSLLPWTLDPSVEQTMEGAKVDDVDGLWDIEAVETSKIM